MDRADNVGFGGLGRGSPFQAAAPQNQHRQHQQTTLDRETFQVRVDAEQVDAREADRVERQFARLLECGDALAGEDQPART